MTASATADPLVGREIAQGRYYVVNVLGKGGMGTVYTALQRPVDRKVALKIIHRELAGNPEIVARFLEEMRLTAAIEHPHTVRVYDFGDIDGQPFLTTEFLDGRSLRDEMLRVGPFAQERVAAICTQIAKALRAAQAHGVVHRDLKPENIMLLDLDGDADYVKVLDFGIARSLNRTTGMRTGTGALLGTPAYMSPEQCEGKPVDVRSDLYTLGLIAYELATGSLPFPPSDSVPQLLLSHVTTPPPDIRTRAPQIGVPLAGLIMRLLAKSPDQRPADAEAVIKALEPLLSPRRPSAAATAAMAATEMGQLTPPPPGPMPTAPPAAPPRSRRVFFTTAIVVAVLGVGSVALWSRMLHTSQEMIDSEEIPPACDPELAALFQPLKAPELPEAQRREGLEKFLARCPTSPQGHLLLGKSLSKHGDDEAAEQHLRQALQLSPSSTVARFNLAIVLLKRDRAPQALPLLDSVLQEVPRHATAHLVRGQARLKNNDPQGARSDLEQQTRIAPGDPAAWLLLAQARRALGDEAGAREAQARAARPTEGAR
jgi:cytochrome c-type biogenesis protein CcmH/NrfG/predicted Ser/Thr protein kinase